MTCSSKVRFKFNNGVLIVSQGDRALHDLCKVLSDSMSQNTEKTPFLIGNANSFNITFSVLSVFFLTLYFVLCNFF